MVKKGSNVGWFQKLGLLKFGLVVAGGVLVVSVGYYYLITYPKVTSLRYLESTLDDLVYVRKYLIVVREKYVELSKLDGAADGFLETKQKLYAELTDLSDDQRFKDVVSGFEESERALRYYPGLVEVKDLYASSGDIIARPFVHVGNAAEAAEHFDELYNYVFEPSSPGYLAYVGGDAAVIKGELASAQEGLVHITEYLAGVDKSSLTGDQQQLLQNVGSVVINLGGPLAGFNQCIERGGECFEDFTQVREVLGELLDALWLYEKSFLTHQNALDDLTDLTNVIIDVSSGVSLLVEYTKLQFALPTK